MNNPSPPVSPAALWTGRVLSGFVILFLLFDGTIKLIGLPIVGATLAPLGYAPTPALIRGIGLMTVVPVLLYAWPRTALLGAILLTGLFGGAMATHLRVGSPLFSHVLFGLYLGAMTWGGLWLRDPVLRGLMPLRR